MNDNILLEVKKLHTAICQYIFDQSKESSHGRHPNPLQIRIYDYLRKNKDKDIYQKDIQESLDVSKAAISDTLHTMEKKKIIERIPSKVDGRKIKIILTKEGLDVFKEIDKDMKQVNKKILESITKEELEEFIRISHKIKENLKKEGTK